MPCTGTLAMIMGQTKAWHFKITINKQYKYSRTQIDFIHIFLKIEKQLDSDKWKQFMKYIEWKINVIFIGLGLKKEVQWSYLISLTATNEHK